MRGKSILLVIGGGIAAYKSLELIRRRAGDRGKETTLSARAECARIRTIPWAPARGAVSRIAVSNACSHWRKVRQRGQLVVLEHLQPTPRSSGRIAQIELVLMLFLPAACGCLHPDECPVPPRQRRKRLAVISCSLSEWATSAARRRHQSAAIHARYCRAGFEADAAPRNRFQRIGLCRIEQAQTVVRNVRASRRTPSPVEKSESRKACSGKRQRGRGFSSALGDDAQRAARTGINWVLRSGPSDEMKSPSGVAPAARQPVVDRSRTRDPAAQSGELDEA